MKGEEKGTLRRLSNYVTKKLEKINKKPTKGSRDPSPQPTDRSAPSSPSPPSSPGQQTQQQQQQAQPQQDDQQQQQQQQQVQQAAQQDQQQDSGKVEQNGVQEGEVEKKKPSFADFETLTIIGRGGFGEVRLCRKKGESTVYAVKIIKKLNLREKQITRLRAERDVMVFDNPWIVKLHYSFQDQKHLYLVMEFCQGGDLMNILMKYDILSEDQTRFYIAELAMAIHAVHELNYLHRDLKPDNVLLDRQGHVKLSDFGLCKAFEASGDQAHLVQAGLFNVQEDQQQLQQQQDQEDAFRRHRAETERRAEWKQNRRALAVSKVGTPAYMAPEIFSGQGYGHGCDWWSLGVIMFESLVGYPPFYGADTKETVTKLINWKRYLHFPDPKPGRPPISPIARDLIEHLICEAKERYRFDQIKAHAFFQGVNWENIRDTEAPIDLHVDDDLDTRNFAVFEEKVEDESQQGVAYPIQGYTYERPKAPPPSAKSVFDAIEEGE